MDGFANQYPQEALLALTKSYGIVEVGEYQFGYFECYTSKQEILQILPFELEPLNRHTEHYIVTMVTGENAWWLEFGESTAEVTELAFRLNSIGLPVPENIYELDSDKLLRLNNALHLAEEAAKVI